MMNQRSKTCTAALIGLTAVMATVGCSSSGSDTSLTDGTAAPVEEAQQAFCDDLGSYIQVIDRYGRVFTEDQLTVGQLQTTAAELTAARVKVNDAADDLADAITAASRSAQIDAANGSSTTSTTAVLTTKTADEHIEAITSAEEDLKTATTDVDASTPVVTAAAGVQAAAFGVEQAYVSLFTDAGCLADDASAAQAIDAYVKGLQQDLTSAGYYTAAVDGLYGTETAKAVMALQKASGLPETGVVDPATEAALASALAAKGKQDSLNVAALQGALTATGDYTGPIDGIWTPALEESITSYQQSQQLPTTGALDPATLAALLLGGSQDPTTTTTTTPGSSTTSTSATASTSTTTGP